VSPARPRLASLAAAAAVAAFVGTAAADDATVLRWGDGRAEAAEEAFILAGREAPLLERPVLAGRLRRELLELEAAAAGDEAAGPEAAAAAVRAAEALAPDDRPVAVSLNASLGAGYLGSPGRNAFARPPRVFEAAALDDAARKADALAGDLSAVFRNSGPGDRAFLKAEAMSAALAAPSLLDLRALLRAGPVALDLDPELRPASNFYREGSPWYLNYALAVDPARVDVNIPYRGVATFLSGPFELRFGRDKLHLGPGRRSALSFNASMPWADFASARVDAGPVSLSWYLVRLNPYLTVDEERYLDAVREYPVLRADPAANEELIGTEAEKNVAVGRLTWRICPWATVALTQHDLVAGRSIQLSDFNPLLVWHDLFQEGAYGVPAMLEASVTPLPGLRLYGQYMLYDATIADEVGSSTNNVGASAYQAGLSAVFRPFSAAGPLGTLLGGTRLRMDAEFTLTDPWVYGKAYSYRQFASRYVFVEPDRGRYWVDYPIGPEFGPDGADLDLRASLGNPGGAELSLGLGYHEQGSITLIGYGDGSDYAHQSSYARDGLVYVKAGQSAERRVRAGLDASSPDWRAGAARISATGSIVATWASSYGCVPGDNRFWLDGSLSLSVGL
jgi:hypothetical protein